MSNPPSLLNRQPDHIKAKIIEMAHTERYNDIVTWLNDQGIDASYNQVRHFVSTHGIRTRLQPIAPVKGHAAKVQVYISALLAYEADTFTIGNIRLHGPSWSVVTRRLKEDGMIEPMQEYSPKRWRIIVSKKKLKEWMEMEIKT